MQQNVSEILVFDHKPSVDNPASVIDILIIDGSVSEAAQTYKRHWQGGHYRGGHAGNYVCIRAGYTLADKSTFFPFGYSPL